MQATSKPIIIDEQNRCYTLYFPKFYSDNKSNEYEECPCFCALIDRINKFKEETDSMKFNKTNINNVEIKTEINIMLQDVISEYNRVENYSKLKTYIATLKNRINEIIDKDCNEIGLLKMLLLYQYYDIPYTMHFFMPQKKYLRRRTRILLFSIFNTN